MVLPRELARLAAVSSESDVPLAAADIIAAFIGGVAATAHGAQLGVATNIAKASAIAVRRYIGLVEFIYPFPFAVL